MAFWDQFTKGIQNVSKDLAGKAQDISENMKLKSRINDAENLLKSTFAEIGENFFQEHERDEDSPFAEQFAIIREAKESILRYKEEIRRLKGVSICPECGAEIADDAVFCPHCGKKIEKPVQEEPAAEPAPEEEILPEDEAEE